MLANQNNVDFVHPLRGDTPLHHACTWQDWLDVVKLFIEKYGGDPNVKTKSNQSLLHYACQYGSIDIVEYLINKQHLNPLMREDIDQLEPLDCALNNNEADIAVYLCQHCISSDEMLNPNRIKTTVNLIKYMILRVDARPFVTRSLRVPGNQANPFDPRWKTADGDNVLRLVGSSKTCISHIPSAILLEILNSYDANYYNIIVFKPDLLTADGDTIFQLVCQSKITISQISSTVLTKWLSDSTAALYLMKVITSDWKTVDGDTLFELICQSEKCLLQISSAEFLKWLRKTPLNYVTTSIPDCKTADGDTLLQLILQSAMSMSRISSGVLVKLLSDSREITINEMKNVNPTWKMLNGTHFLHAVCQSNIDDKTIELMQYYILENSWNPDSDYLDSEGNTALHIACQANKIALVSYLIDQAQCNPNIKNKKGNLPLDMTTNLEVINYLCQHDQVAVYSKTVMEWMNKLRSVDDATMLCILQSLVDKNRHKTKDGSTLLHVVCTCSALRDTKSLVDYLLTECQCDPNCLDNKGQMPLQLTSDSKIMKTLIKHGAKMTPGQVLRFEAKESAPMKPELIKLMLTTWNPDDKDSDGYTALHLACKADRPTTVNLLLSVAHCNPNIKSNSGEVPLHMTTDPVIIKNLIRHGAKTSIMYQSHKKSLGTNKPIQPPVKVFIVGNPSVGKSTLTAALKRKTGIIARIFSGKVSGVDKKTVGIVPHDLESEVFGRVTLYDFAGHREFYSGHAALLQTAIQSTPPVFLLVINLCEDEDEIIKTILYWISFLENQCASVSCRPHIILVGSHADALNRINPKDKVKIIVESLDTECFTNMECIGFVPMNCQYHESTGMNDLRHLLIKSCEKLRIQEPITFNAHCFLVFLIDTFVDQAAVAIEVISETIENQQSKEGVLEFLPKTIEALYKICLELNDRGHILLLKDRVAIENSYIVIDKEFLLSEISGTVFATEGFKQYKDLSSNTGVVPSSKIVKSFPDSDINVLIGFLTHLEFCHEISDQALLQHISNDYSQASNERYYLFPGLISLEAESNVWETESHFSLHFGWTLQCPRLEQFLTSRFLQVLLLRLAFSLALESKCDGGDVIGIHRKCSIWKNGIFWGREFGMETLVEVIEDKSVVVITRFQTSNLEKCLKHRSEVLHTVLECLNRFCPRVSVIESFIDTSSPLRYPFALISDKTFCSVQDLAQAVVSNCESPSVVLSGSGKIVPAERFLSFEPYIEIESLTLQELWDKNNQEKLISDKFLSNFVRKASNKLNWFAKIFNDSANIPSCSRDDLFHELIKWRDNKMTYKDFRQQLDQYSVFTGRNVLVSMMSTHSDQLHYISYNYYTYHITFIQDLAGHKYEPPSDEGKKELQTDGDLTPKLRVEGILW